MISSCHRRAAAVVNMRIGAPSSPSPKCLRPDAIAGADRPGLFIRDPYHYSDAGLIIPPPLVECLRCFDGLQTELDLRSTLVRITGDLQVGELEKHLVETLSSAGFLEDEAFAEMKADRQKQFAESSKREPAHAGGAYPAEIVPLRDTMARYMDGAGGLPERPNRLCGIAAPHVSPEGGWQSYRAAYQTLDPGLKDRTFVILATSHYGAPEHFGLTRKTFVTPFGESATDTALVDRLEAKAGPPSLWKTTATPSSTPSSFRWSSCNISSVQTFASSRFFAASTPIASIVAEHRKPAKACAVSWASSARWLRERATGCSGC